MAAGSRARAVGVLLRVIALACAAMTLLELYRAGVRWGPLGKPMVYHFAAASSLAVALAAFLRRERVALPFGFAAVAFAVYLANDQRLMSGDTQPATLVPYALVRHGTLALDDVAPHPVPPWILPSRGHLWSQYPIATGLLALPVYLPAALGPGAPGQSHPEKVAAALIAAASAGFVLATLLRLGANAGAAFLATAVYAFASPVLSVAAQALWQHTGGVLAFSAGLYCAVRARDDPRAEPWIGVCAGVATAARPTNLIAAAALVLVASERGRRSALRVLGGAAVPFALLGLYQAVAFGAPWRTGYAGQAFGFGAHLGAGLIGVLCSPTRGLFTYVPWALLAAFGLVLAARREPLALAALAGASSIVLIHAAWNDWPGGWGYGPRLVTDAMPLLAFGIAVLMVDVPRPRWVIPALVVTALFAAWLAWLGSFRQYESPARDVYLGADVHAMEWWRYPPVQAVRRR